MKVRIEDKDALQALSWEALKDYLDRAKGWKYAEDIADKAAVYQHKNKSGRLREIIVPVRRDLGDYARRMADAVSTLARVEKRSELDVYEDLSKSGEAAAYKVHARIRKWLAEERWIVQDIEEPQTSFNVQATLQNGIKVNIFQLKDYLDHITLTQRWVYDDEFRATIGRLAEEDVEDIVWKIYRDVSMMGLEFDGLDTPSVEMVFRAHVFFDGLTKDTLIQRILVTILALGLAVRTFVRELEARSRSGDHAPSSEELTRIRRLVPRTEGLSTRAG